MKKVALHNLGCKVNSYETEAMQELLENNGYEIVPFKEGADIYIINTCTVTNMADRKSRQMLHKAKKMNPDAIVVAAGCYVQVKDDADMDESIDLVIGNNKKHELIEILKSYDTHSSACDCEPGACENCTCEEKAVIDINNTSEYEELQVTKTTEHTRAYLKVQDGCNQFCSYCIIPYARGRIRSRDKDDVVSEVKRLASNGYKEVVLTGIHLSSYGVDMDGREDLLSLIEAVHEVEGIERIRLGSLEPRIITEEFARKTAALPKMCPHFHLSLQSGCDETLKRMNRKYTAKEYKAACELLRRYYGLVHFTTDIIVGFPGETEDEFQATKAFVEEIGFYETHVFKYSKREGTKAAIMKEQVQENVKAIRSNVLIDLCKNQQGKLNHELQGEEVSVLLEEKISLEGNEYYTGHTKEYVKVAILADGYTSNEVIVARIGEKLQIMN
ncbi:MAG: tRNA (N(6)-L-threonylcarbamoyladenosine(37)-C(2))-methylthiotransferase MtaB [Eubacteriales bacterium]